MIGERTVDGLEALTLSSPDGAGLEVAFVPAAGMVGCSLRHRGNELLGQRGGLRHYATHRGTMGIPLLHPWANRLSKRGFAVAGREVTIEPPAPFGTDPNGLAIHGLLAAADGWRIERHEATADRALLAAQFEFAAHPALIEAFPFPHRVSIEARITSAELTVATAITPTGDVAVPVSFGYHPYLRLPGAKRAEWQVDFPVAERLSLDKRMIPTGDREPVEPIVGALGDRTLDDAYLAPAGGARFALGGAGRRIEVGFDRGYPFAQLYAPSDDDVVAIEPMTAPTDALVSGSELSLVEPGDRYSAVFTIAVADQ